MTLSVFGSPTNDTLQISGTVTDSQGHPIVGANVVATLDPNSFTNLIQNGSFETPLGPPVSRMCSTALARPILLVDGIWSTRRQCGHHQSHLVGAGGRRASVF